MEISITEQHPQCLDNYDAFTKDSLCTGPGLGALYSWSQQSYNIIDNNIWYIVIIIIINGI